MQPNKYVIRVLKEGEEQKKKIKEITMAEKLPNFMKAMSP